MCVCESVLGETALMFRHRMRETSNPKHGSVVEMNASAHCQPVRMLTNDAPDSSPPLSSYFFSSSTVAFRLRQHTPPPPTPKPPPPPIQSLRRTWGENHGKTQSDYSPRTVIEYVTNTLRIALGNQIKK